MIWSVPNSTRRFSSLDRERLQREKKRAHATDMVKCELVYCISPSLFSHYLKTARFMPTSAVTKSGEA